MLFHSLHLRMAVAASLIVCAALVTSCGGDEAEDTSAGQTAASLTEGRRFRMRRVDRGELTDVVVVVGDPDTGRGVDDVRTVLTSECTALINTRFGAVTTTSGSICSVRALATEQQVALCEGHGWSQLASAVVPVDFFASSYELRRPVESEERPSELMDELTERGLVFSIPVPSNESATTFRLLATEAFRAAAIAGAELLDPETCPSGNLSQLVAGGRRDGEEGLSSLPADRISLAQLVTGTIAESITQLRVTADDAEEGIVASAQAVLSTERDSHLATVMSWRGAHDSRAGALSLWSGGAYCPFCQSTIACGGPGVCQCPEICLADDGTVDLPGCNFIGSFYCDDPGDQEPGCTPGDPACDPGDVCLPSATSDERGALDVLRALAVDPRTSSTRTETDVLQDVRDAFIEDQPGSFAGTSGIDPSTWVETYTPYDAAAFLGAARQLAREAIVLGRVITPDSESPRSVPRVRGTRAVSRPPAPAHVFARGSGGVRFDDTAALAAEDARRGRTTGTKHYPTASYAERGVLNTIDFVAGRLRQAMARADVIGGLPATSAPPPGTALYNAVTTHQLARDMVPARARIEIGQRATGGINTARLRLYGVGTTPAAIEVWWGTAGLQCATTGTVEGQPCDLTQHRLRMTPISGTDTREENGFGRTYVQITISPTHLPFTSSAIPGTGRLFVTRRRGARREVLTGFGLSPGNSAGTYSRITFLPIGEETLERATRASLPNPDSCDEPELCCADLPCNLRVPLENELFSTSVGRDDVEESFAHYIRQARAAADEADTIGQQMVEQGFQMDVQAELARDALEDLCGGVVNVDTLGPKPCAVDADCGTGQCVAHICWFPDGLAQMLDASSPDSSGVRQCLDGGSLRNVSLGDRPVCYFQYEGFPPCQCPLGEDDCPETCLIVSANETGNDCDELLGVPTENAFATEPLGLGEAAPAEADDDDTTCVEHFAVLRGADSQDEREDAAEALLDSEWLTQSNLWLISEMMGSEPNMFQTTTMTRGGALWLTTGTPEAGPVTEYEFPCGGHSILSDLGHIRFAELCHGSDSGGRALSCGLERDSSGDEDTGCDNVYDRININSRLLHAATVLARLTGASAGNLYRPAYRGDPVLGTFPGNYDSFIDDYGNPFGRHGGDSDILAADSSGCEYNLDEFGPIRWMRVRDSFFTRYCGPDSSCDDEESCASWFVDHGWFSFPDQQDLPEWFQDQYDVPFGVSAHFMDELGESEICRDAPYSCDRWLVERGEVEARCYLIPNPTDELSLAVGAVCPTFFTRMPVSLAGAGPDAWVDTNRIPLLSGGGGVTPNLRPTEPITRMLFWSGLPEATAVFDPEEEPETVLTHSQLLRGTADDDYGRWEPAPIHLREEPYDNQPYGRLLDALELACIASVAEGGVCPADAQFVPQINSLDQAHALEAALDCAATKVEHTLATMTLFNVPGQVADDLETGALTGVYPEYQGTYGQKVAELRSSVETVRVSVRQIATTLRDFSSALEVARIQSAQEDSEDQLSVLQATGATAQYVTDCAQSVANIQFFDGSFGIQSTVTAGAVCANAAIQIGLQWQMQAIQGEINESDRKMIYLQLVGAFTNGVDSLAAASSNLSAGIANIQGLLAALDQQRNEAERLASQVLFQTVDESGREYHTNRVMRAQMNTLRIRYEAKRRQAIQSAWLARMALEQRLGVDLNELTEDMYLVPAPATWIDRVCTMPAINYDEIRDVTFNPEWSYADAFIGDYVDDLERLWDSYTIDYNFQDADDVAVISLRDEVMGISVPCDVEGYNQLRWSVNTTIGGRAGWAPRWDEDGYAVSNTFELDTPFPAEQLVNVEGEVTAVVSNSLASATAQRLTVTAPEELPADPTARPGVWGQDLTLERGLYLLSWYERIAEPDDEGECPGAVSPAESLLVPVVAGSTDVDFTPLGYLDPTTEPWLGSCWRRAAVEVDTPRDQTANVGFAVREAPMEGAVVLPSVVWSAPQLERMPLASEEPRPFFPTDRDNAFLVGLCEDTDGQVFRDPPHWEYGCERLCPDGFSGTCAGEDTHCFWETTFDIRLPEIEAGNTITPGSFAVGSYNHRTIQLALNLVGTGVRDCSESETPSSCYASGFVPYALRHEGPYRVRNHFGGTYDAPLYVGHIEHAKALTAERYITNPISSADRALLTDYFHSEFLGRPIDGSYRLRIYETDGFRWDRVRDVQLVWYYRYWTRTE